MKKVKRLLSSLLVFVMVFVMMGCSSSKSDKNTDTNAETNTEVSTEASKEVSGTSFTAGTYTATKDGNNGEITVEVTFTENSIESIVVTSHQETEGLGSNAMETISNAIIENQSLAVDTVSGATVSSNAILAAIEDCVTQAGGDVEVLKGVVIEKVVGEDEEITADVVVVGGGGSGLTAALTAQQNGKNVVVIEKFAVAGGSFSAHSDGTIRPGTEEGGTYFTPEQLYVQWTTANKGAGNDALIKKVAYNANDTINWVESSLGLKYVTNNDWKFAIETVTLNPEGTYEENMGKRYTDAVVAKFVEIGGTVYYETTGKSIIMNDNGEAVGVIAEKADGSKLTCNASSVIIATGGFAAQVGSAEGNGVINAYFPSLTNTDLITGDHPASDGTGIMMGVEAGAGTTLTGSGVRGNFRLKSTGGLLHTNALFVNQNGERFANEGMQYQVFYTALKNDYSCFEILDSKNAYEGIEADVEAGTVHKADTLEALAGIMNVDVDTFKTTVERYNSLVGGEDTDFNKNATLLVSVDTAPYYVADTFLRIAGSIGGLLTDDNCQVMKEDGSLIPNLYAVGDAANGNLHGEEYVGGGTGTTYALNTGRIAGFAVSEQ